MSEKKDEKKLQKLREKLGVSDKKGETTMRGRAIASELVEAEASSSQEKTVPDATPPPLPSESRRPPTGKQPPSTPVAIGKLKKKSRPRPPTGKKPPAVPKDDKPVTAGQEPPQPPISVESTLQLSDDDLEMLDEMQPKPAADEEPTFIQDQKPEPELEFEPESDPEPEPEPSTETRPSTGQVQPMRAIQDDVGFYYREASAMTAQQPERAGMMWYEAARVAELVGSDQKIVLEYLRSALRHTPDNPALLSLVRRAMMRLHQHDQALDLTARLTQVGGEGVERVAALIEAATLQRHVKGDGQRALQLLQQAVDLQPAHVAALTLSAVYQLEVGQHEGAAETLEQLAEVLSVPQDRAACLHTAGTLRELRLEQPDRAEQDYTRAVEWDPGSVPAWSALAELHQQTGAWHRLCHDLEQIASLDIGAASRLGFLLRAGSLHIHRTDDLEAAGRIFALAAESAPSETAPLTRLAHVFEVTGRQEDLVTTLQRLLQLTLDPPGQAVLLVRIGRLLENQHSRMDEAINAYRQALNARPGYFPSLQALGTIFRQRSDHNSLLEILLPETEGTDDPQRRAMRCMEVGGILADRLQRPEEAIEYYQRALELDPDLRLAGWRLGSLLHQQQRFSELARLLAWQAEVTSDDRSRHHLLVELARLQAGPLQASHRAIETLTRARAIDKNRIAAMELLELHNRTGNYSELVDLMLSEATQITDLAEANWRRIQAAMVLEDYLEEHDRALGIFWEVLEKVPTCVGAIRAAGQIYYTHGRWLDLIKLHEHELEHDPGLADAAEPWCRIGRIYEEELGQHKEAIEAYKKALALDTGSTIALDALERLIRIEQRYRELIPVLQRYARRRREPFAAADILCRGAELADSRLGDLARGVLLYEEALKLHPTSFAALHGLLSIQLRQGSIEAACATLQGLIDSSSDPASQSLLVLQQARLKEFRLNEVPNPAPYDLAAQVPSMSPRIRLEQIRTRLATGDEQLPAVLLAMGAHTADPMLSLGLLLEGAHRYEWSHETEGQREAAKRALARNQDELAVIWSLQRALRATEDWGGLAALLEAEAVKQEDSTISTALLSEAAEAYLRDGLVSEASRLSGQCLSVDEQHLPSIHRLTQLAAQQQNYNELASLFDQLAKACVDRGNRLQTSLLAADCWFDHVGDPSNALNSLKRALADDPTHPDAFTRAERLLTSMGEHGQLSQLFSQRIESCKPSAEKAKLLRQHVRLLREKLNDTPRAIAELNKLLELFPEDLEGLRALAQLLQEAGRWSDAAGALAQIAKQTKDPAQRKQALLDQAGILLKRLQQPKNAYNILQTVLKEDPASLEAKRLLVEVHVEDGQWEQAQRLLDEVTAEDRPELQVWAMTQLAEVARVGLRDEGMRENYELGALTLASDHPSLLDELVERYRQRRRQTRLLELGTKVVDQTTSANAAARLRLVLARLLLEDVNQPDRAIEYLRDSLAIDPQNTQANLLMAQALEGRGEMEGAAESYRKLLAEDPRCVEAYHGLNRLMGVLGKPALATAAVSLLDLLGASTPAQAGQVKALDQMDTPTGTLQLSALPHRPELKPVSQVIELAAPYLGSVYPLKLQKVLKWTEAPAMAAKQLAGVVGLSGVKVSIEGEAPARAGVGDPALLQISPAVARRPNSPIFRFWVGRALARAATAGALLERLSDGELGELIEALLVARPIDTLVQRLRKQVSKALPRKIRKQLEQLADLRVDLATWQRYRAEEQLRADQIGLVICGNPKVAITQLAAAEGLSGDLTQSPRVRELMLFTVSDRFAVLHAMLWRASGSIE